MLYRITAGIERDKDGALIDPQHVAIVEHNALLKLACTFGGATVRRDRGSYFSEETRGIVVEETLTFEVLVAYADQQTETDITAFATWLRDKLNQESVLVTEAAQTHGTLV